MHKYILLFLFAISASSVSAQIQVTADDFRTQLQIGRQVTTYNDRTNTSVDIGSTGQTTWDFSGLKIDDQFVTESKDVASSPYTADFPGAEYTSNYSGVFQGTQSNTWVYNSVGANFISHGTGTVSQTVAGNTKIKITFDPARVEYELPLDFGDSWSFTGNQTIATTLTLPFVGEQTTIIVQQRVRNFTVDAYGTVTMPDGKRLPALRIKEESTLTGSGVNEFSVIYHILTKTGESVSITIANPTPAKTDGNVAISAISWTTGSGVDTPPVESVNNPSGLTAIVNGNNIDLSWTDNSDNESGFKVERSESGTNQYTQLVELGAGVTMYSDATATAGTAYSYRVKAFNNDAESGYSNEASATVPLPIVVNDPSNLSAVVNGSNIDLSWTDNSDNENGFKVERSGSGTNQFAQIVELGAGVTMYNDATATAGTAYSYRVKAFNNDAESGFSNEASAIVPLPIVVNDPSNLSAVVNGSNIDLSWTDNSDNENGFKVERSESGTNQYTQLVELGAGVTMYSDATATAGTAYSYRVKAFNDDAESGYSNEASATVPLPIVVNDPSNLSAVVNGSNIDLSWTDNSDNENGFKVERSESGTNQYTQLVELGAGVTMYSDATATMGTAYSYRVKAFNDDAESGYSNEASATVPLPIVVNVPTNLSAVVNGSNIDLSWTDNSDNESGFKVERSENGTNQYTQLVELGAGVTIFSDATVTAGTTYSYRVKAFNNDAESGYSNEASATVPLPIVVNPPSSLEAVIVVESIQLMWIDNSENEQGFILERAEGSEGLFEEIGQLNADVNSFVDNNVQDGTTYKYRIKAYLNEVSSEYSNIANLGFFITGVESVSGQIPDEYSLNQNYPNPFNPSTRIQFAIPEGGNAKLIVYNSVGQEVAVLVDRTLGAGIFVSEFDASFLPSGLYLYKLTTDKFSKIKKMILIK